MHAAEQAFQSIGIILARTGGQSKGACGAGAARGDAWGSWPGKLRQRATGSGPWTPRLRRAERPQQQSNAAAGPSHPPAVIASAARGYGGLLEQLGTDLGQGALVENARRRSRCRDVPPASCCLIEGTARASATGLEGRSSWFVLAIMACILGRRSFGPGTGSRVTPVSLRCLSPTSPSLPLGISQIGKRPGRRARKSHHHFSSCGVMLAMRSDSSIRICRPTR